MTMAHKGGHVGAAEIVTVVFFAEPRNVHDRDELEYHATKLLTIGDVRLLCDGTLVAYLARVGIGAAPLLTLLNTTLKRDYRFGHVEMSVHPTVLGVIEDIADGTPSDFIPVGPCSLCGSDDILSGYQMVLGEDGVRRASGRFYCPGCAKDMAVSPCLRSVRTAAVA